MQFKALGIALIAIIAAGCSQSDVHESTSENTQSAHRPFESTPGIRQPPTSGRFDYQLGGAYPPPSGVSVVARDVTDEPAAGLYSICYVNGFQTQPGEEERWLGTNEDLLLHREGELVVDPDWPDEYVLDPTDPQRRERIASIIGESIDSCAELGYDAIEIDNLDSWSRFPELDQASSIALAETYVTRAHDSGLAIGQKNSAETVVAARTELHFDFAVVEECWVFDECDAYVDEYGPYVYDVEYTDSLDVPFTDVCSSSGHVPLTVLRDRDLVTNEHPDYVYEHC
ncbi:endo alpha-1,4 polygalactosaminidase [Williamsia sp.]|uniref:endo alpha-1,4 polygalactosaminidase n=1 Tax=Williamsia sp. TaxID=1872085 RepID=UPI002F93F706